MGFLSSSLLSSKHLESILIHHHEAMKLASTLSIQKTYRPMSLVSIGALHTCVLYMDCDPGHKFSKMQCFDCTCAESPEVGQILFEKSHSSLKPFTIETLYKPFIFSLLETSMHLNLSSLINSKYS